MLDRVLDAFAAARVLPFDATALAALDSLLTQGVRLATMDLRIAAIALSRMLVLLTRNTRASEKCQASSWRIGQSEKHRSG
jgi:tRNA(fMet)-specific endonuclease VapC